MCIVLLSFPPPEREVKYRDSSMSWSNIVCDVFGLSLLPFCIKKQLALKNYHFHLVYSFFVLFPKVKHLDAFVSLMISKTRANLPLGGKEAK